MRKLQLLYCTAKQKLGRIMTSDLFSPNVQTILNLNCSQNFMFDLSLNKQVTSPNIISSDNRNWSCETTRKCHMCLFFSILKVHYF